MSAFFKSFFSALLLASVSFTIQAQETAAQYQVELVGGEQVFGENSDSIRLNTEFGHVVFNADGIRSISAKDGKHSIRTATGITITGQIQNEGIDLKTANGIQTIVLKNIGQVNVVSRAPLVPGEITDGVAGNGMTYHVRVPEDFDQNQKYKSIVILHGSNMNSRDYVNTIAQRWPELGKEYVLIGINGENEARNFSAENPRYNYSYVNFVGKSTYKGYPGTDRESPALVSEVLTELNRFIPISKTFVGGHSQGGYLTYSVMMNYPDQVDGAFPISAGMIFQTDPTAYDDLDLRKLQRQNPLAIVHATNDRVVKFSMSEAAHKAFLQDSYPMLRLVTSERAGHSFAALPVEEAIQWLDSMTTADPNQFVEFAALLKERKMTRDLLGLLNRDDLPKLSDEQSKMVDAMSAELEIEAQGALGDLFDQMQANNDGSWVKPFVQFRNTFEFTKAAGPLMERYLELKAEHEKPANKIHSEAMGLFQSNKKDEGYAKCQEIVEKYYASSKYSTVKGWLDKR